MASDSTIQLAAAGLLIASLGGSVYLTQEVAGSVGRHGLVYTDSAEEGTPKEVAVGIAMGAFRGLFVNMLWMRAQKAKDQGNYYEAMDLAKAITKLQPRFPRVWAFHAWNMAYNISVTTNTAPERWQWVNNGIRLLREQGIPANPNDLLIHRELAWIFLHKIQGFMDDANLYYKRTLADEWTVVLGPPRPADITKSAIGPRTRQQATDDAVGLLTRIWNAPDELADIVKAQPEAQIAIDALKSEAQIDLTVNEDRLRFLRMIEMGRAISRVGSNIPSLRLNPDRDPVLRLLGRPELVPAWELIVPHVRKRVITDIYRMEIERMIKYTRQYGPLDWRHPATHALYWSSRGVDEALEKVTERNGEDFDFLNTDRIRVQALQELYRSGSLQFDILRPQFYLAIPSADFIPTYREALDDLVEREWVQMRTKGATPETRPYNMYAAGYENFMRDAISFLFRRGDKQGAQDLKTQLLADFNRGLLNKNNYELQAELEEPLETFVIKQIEDRLTTPNIAVQEINGSLFGAFLSLLAGDSEAFTNQLEYARMFHAHYMQEQFRQTGVDTSARLEMLPRDFRDTVGQMFAACVMRSGIENGSIMYSRAPTDVRQWAYDPLVEFVKPEVDAGVQAGMPGFDLWFPKPEGLDEYRALRQAERGNQPREAEKIAK